MSAARARALYKAFYKKEPPAGAIVLVDMKRPVDAVVIGELDSVTYHRADQPNKKPYLHQFSKNRRPQLLVTSDGKQIFVLGGAFGFNAQGFKG